MFDIGFWELLLIAIVSLFVIGPEKFPGFIRETGLWISKIRRFINQTQREINQQLLLHERQSFQQKVDDLDDLMKNAPDNVLNTDAENEKDTQDTDNHHGR